MPSPRHPDRRSLAELVEELRDEALEIAPDLNGIPAEETSYGEAAQTLQEFGAALIDIANGAGDPASVAAEALSLSKPLRPIRESGDPVRTLLKPKPI